MGYIYEGTERWLDSIGAGDTKQKLLNTMASNKQKASNDGVTYKNEGTNMDTEVVKNEEAVTGEEVVKDENTTEVVVENDTTVAEEVETPVSEKAVTVLQTIVADGFESVNNNFTNVAEIIVELQTALVELQTELAELRAELETVQAEQLETKQETLTSLPLLSFQSIISKASDSAANEKDEQLADTLMKDAVVEADDVVVEANNGIVPLFAF